MKKTDSCKIVRFGVIPEEYFTKSTQFLSFSKNNGYKYDIAYIGFGLTEISALEDAIEQAKLDKWDIENVVTEIEKQKNTMKRLVLAPEREDEGYWVGLSLRQVIPD